MKYCNKCLTNKDESEFYNKEITPSMVKRYPHVCKECVRKKAKLTYWKDPEKYKKLARDKYCPEKNKAQHLKYSFGIDIQWYKDQLEKQKGVCAICKKPEVSKRNGKIKALTVDHCHKTGKVRGLLCTLCNSILGYAKDNPSILLNGAEYLNKNNQNPNPYDLLNMP